MSFKDVLKVLNESEVKFDDNLYIPAIYGDGQHLGPCLSKKWNITRGESEPEFDSLDEVLSLLAPSITCLHYRQICRELIKRETYDDSDYYNTIEYGIKYLRLEDLHQFLENMGYI